MIQIQFCERLDKNLRIYKLNSMDKLQEMAKGMTGNVEGIEVPEVQSCEEKEKLYTVAGKDLAKLLCESLYTEDGLNLKDLFKKSIADAVTTTLNTPNGRFQTKVNSLVFDNLNKYTKELFKVSTGTKDVVNGFTSRILQTCFATEDSIIPELLKTSISQINEVSELTPDRVTSKMVETIKNNLKPEEGEKEEEEAETASTEEGAVGEDAASVQEEGTGEEGETVKETISTDNLGSACTAIAKEEKKSELVTLTQPPSEQTAEPICNLNTELVAQGNTLINVITNSDNFKTKIENKVTDAFESFFNKKQQSFFNKILESVTSSANNYLMNDIVKTHILYCILSYESEEDNTSPYYIGNQIFNEAISKFLSRKDVKDNWKNIPLETCKEFTQSLKEILLDKIAIYEEGVANALLNFSKGGKRPKTLKLKKRMKSRKMKKMKKRISRKIKKHNRTSYRK